VLQRLASLVFLLPPCALCAQTANLKPPEVQGHSIGESIAELLSKEPEVQQKLDICGRNPRKPTCASLLAAVKSGTRTEVSTSNRTDFVLDGGKLVKLTTLVNETSDAKADLTKKFGPRSSESAFPMQNVLGQNWEDHLYVWDTPTIYVALREDNNPASQNHHFVLVIESRAEQAREDRDETMPPSAAKTDN
jgi:hypothetical protein